VLVADPDAASRLDRAGQLRDRGFRVAVAGTPFETIVKASCQLPDLILIDSALDTRGPLENVEPLEALENAEPDGTARLLSTCPATAHIPIVRLPATATLPTGLSTANWRP
jgi:CheY-like chemotaxis protein